MMVGHWWVRTPRDFVEFHVTNQYTQTWSFARVCLVLIGKIMERYENLGVLKSFGGVTPVTVRVRLRASLHTRV